MERFGPPLFAVSLAAIVLLPACIDLYVPPPTYAFRMVKIADQGDRKVATLGAPDLASGHCTLRGDSAYVLKPDGEGEFQGFTSTTQAGETWRQTAGAFTEAGTTLLDLDEQATSMGTANRWQAWSPRHFHFDPSLYKAVDALEFQGECY